MPRARVIRGAAVRVLFQEVETLKIVVLVVWVGAGALVIFSFSSTYRACLEGGRFNHKGLSPWIF